MEAVGIDPRPPVKGQSNIKILVFCFTSPGFNISEHLSNQPSSFEAPWIWEVKPPIVRQDYRESQSKCGKEFYCRLGKFPKIFCCMNNLSFSNAKYVPIVLICSRYSTRLTYSWERPIVPRFKFWSFRAGHRQNCPPSVKHLSRPIQ
jgi:hypothetical protein